VAENFKCHKTTRLADGALAVIPRPAIGPSRLGALESRRCGGDSRWRASGNRLRQSATPSAVRPHDWSPACDAPRRRNNRHGGVNALEPRFYAVFDQFMPRGGCASGPRKDRVYRRCENPGDEARPSAGARGRRSSSARTYSFQPVGVERTGATDHRRHPGLAHR